MRIEHAKYEILTDISHPFHATEMMPGVTYSEQEPGRDELKLIEKIARKCYKSEDKISEDTSSAKRLIRSLIANGHEAMLEHGGQLSVCFTCDRAVSHELVRHRIASFAQESQRYCNYSSDKFGGHVSFILPSWMEEDEDDLGFVAWRDSCMAAEKKYFDLLDTGYLPEQARSVLPNSTKTEIVVTANYREWRHIFQLRTAENAHPDMRALMRPLLREMQIRLPVIFDDITWEEKK